MAREDAEACWRLDLPELEHPVVACYNDTTAVDRRNAPHGVIRLRLRGSEVGRAQLESDAKLAASVARRETRVAQRRALGVILRFEEGVVGQLGRLGSAGLMQKPKAALVVPE